MIETTTAPPLTPTGTALDGVPVIRRSLCWAVSRGKDSRLLRERNAGWSEAFAYAQALRALASAGPLPDGIAPSPVGTTGDKRDEAYAREWLGTSADELLGPKVV